MSWRLEPNPRPKKSRKCQPLKFYHWNVNSILSENFLSETLLSSSVSSTLDSLNIDGYNIIRSDRPSGSKRGGVCCYLKESFLIRILKITLMTECLVLEML